MAKSVDITEKLSFDGNPSLMIKKQKIEVNADAPTMLKIMGLMGGDDPSVNEILQVYDLIFPEESKKKIEELKLGFHDLIVVIESAVSLITGEDVPVGEQ